MRTFQRLKHRTPGKLPPEFAGEDLRYPEELAALFVREHTRPGDLVLDPFAGYGTTLAVAEAMGRRAAGVEFDARRVAYARSRLRDPAALLCGDSRQIAALGLPPCDLVMTSPPFMERADAEYALEGYERTGKRYHEYLAELAGVFAQVRGLMRPGARAVLEVANLRGPAGVTTLAWDVACAVGEILPFVGEVVIGWDRPAYGYDHSYCLVFGRGE
jgi:SAM-dependent methyltransferase